MWRRRNRVQEVHIDGLAMLKLVKHCTDSLRVSRVGVGAFPLSLSLSRAEDKRKARMVRRTRTHARRRPFLSDTDLYLFTDFAPFCRPQMVAGSLLGLDQGASPERFPLNCAAH